MNPAVGEVADGDILAAYVAPANHDRLALLALHRKAVLFVEGGRGRGGFGRDFLKEIFASLGRYEYDRIGYRITGIALPLSSPSSYSAFG